MKKFYLFLLIFFFIEGSLEVYCQKELRFSGKVIKKSENSQVPFPFCNVYIKNTTVGTITNINGKFRLVVPKKHKKSGQLCVSYMGYKSKKIPLRELRSNQNIIKLEKDPVNIEEIVVMPDSTLLTFLRHAYKSIDKNYPQKPTKLEGFYRETHTSADSNKHLYFSEAILEVYKRAYKYDDDPGQVTIKKSRKKVFPIYNEVNNIKYYGGAFISHNIDLVKNKAEFINPKSFHKYDYELTNTTKLNGRTVYIISFDTNNDSLKGRYKGSFFVDKQSLAYIAFNYSSTQRGINKYNRSFSSSPFSKGIEKDNYVRYTRHQGKWHLRYCKAFGKSFNTKFKSNLNYKYEFLTTKVITDSVKPISYNDRLSYYEIFMDKATPYEESNWKDFNIIKTHPDLLYTNHQADQIYKIEIDSPRKCRYNNKFYSFIKKFNFSYGIKLNKNILSEGYYQMEFDNNTLTQNLKNKQYILGLESSVNYKFNKKYAAKFSVVVPLNKSLKMESLGLGLSYIKNVKPKGKPLFLKMDLSGYWNFNGLQFNKKLKNIEYNNEQISNSKLATTIGKNSFGIRPQCGLSYHATKFIEIFVSASYDIELSGNYKIRFLDEDKLFDKTYRKNLDKNRVFVNNSSLQLDAFNKAPFTFGFGFNFGFN